MNSCTKGSSLDSQWSQTPTVSVRSTAALFHSDAAQNKTLHMLMWMYSVFIINTVFVAAQHLCIKSNTGPEAAEPHVVLPPFAIYLLWFGSHSSFKCSLMISFVHTEPEVTLKIDCVVYSDDNLFPHTRNCLTNVIFWLHALCHLHALQSKMSSQCLRFSLFQSILGPCTFYTHLFFAGRFISNSIFLDRKSVV